MIDTAGVIFSYSPSTNVTNTQKPAGPQTPRKKNRVKKPQNQPQKVQQELPLPPFPKPLKPIPAVPSAPQPFKPLRNPSPTFPPTQRRPFVPPTRSSQPPFPQPNARRGSNAMPWNDPFAFPPQRPPSRYAQANTLRDFLGPEQNQPQIEPKEFYKGLPVEEIPEIVPEEPFDPNKPVLDSSYVDRLFGQIPQEQPKIQKQESVKETPDVQPSPIAEAVLPKPVQQTEIPKKPVVEQQEQLVEQKEALQPSAKSVSPFVPEGLMEPQQSKITKQKVKTPFSLTRLLRRKKKKTQVQAELKQSNQSSVNKEQKNVQSQPQKTKKQESPEDILKPSFGAKKTIGVLLILASFFGILTPIIPRIQLERTYAELKNGQGTETGL